MKKIMKKKYIFCIVLTFACLSLNAQAVYKGSKNNYTENIDALLSKIDKKYITTEILYNRVMPFSNLNRLKENGKITTSDYSNFIQSWSELYRASYKPNFISIDELESNIYSENSSITQIGIINTKINIFDSNKNLDVVNGFYINKTGVNPFIEKQVTIISALKNSIKTSNTGEAIFRLNKNFIIQLTGFKIKNLSANFGNGSIQNLITGGIISLNDFKINYKESGMKEINFEIVYENNTKENIKSKIQVNIPAKISKRVSADSNLIVNFTGNEGITNTISFKGYNETAAKSGTLEYVTYYNLVTNTNRTPKLMKPVIILDGFDPGDKRKINKESIGRNNTDKSLYELLSYGSSNFVDKLINSPLGYDVTLVNFQNGADYIERNAMALIALIQRENQKLKDNGSTEKLTIIGPSMGGLVSRYALAYMEKNNLDHNTKLWVSFDSPHLGANIPIGAQENIYFFGWVGNQQDAKKSFRENFFSPAARQMLIEQLDYKHENQEPIITNFGAVYPEDPKLWGQENISYKGQNNDSPFRKKFMNDLTSNGLIGSNGFPQKLKKIAIVNGTTLGKGNNDSGEIFLKMSGYKCNTLICPGEVVNLRDRFLTSPLNTTSRETFSGKVTNSIFSGNSGKFIDEFNSSISRVNINPRGSMDVVPGGKFYTARIIRDQFEPALTSATTGHSWDIYIPDHTFIPTVSALAFKNSEFSWDENVNRNLVCTNEIPFDSYYAPDNNEEHVSINEGNANWLMEWLKGNELKPRFPMEVYGKSFCDAETKFTISGQETCTLPSPFKWEVSPNIQIINSNQQNIIVKKINNGGGFVKAVFENGQTAIKNIWVGLPSASVTLKSPSGVPYDSSNLPDNSQTKTSWTFNKTYPNDETTEYEFTTRIGNIDYIFNKTSLNDESTVTVNQDDLNILRGQSGTVKISVKNDCGWSIGRATGKTFAFKIYNPTLCESGVGVNCNLARSSIIKEDNMEDNSFKFYPNPTKDIINIEFKNNLNPKIIKLFNLLGNVIREVSLTNNKATINVQDLSKGIYILKMDTDEYEKAHKIIIN